MQFTLNQNEIENAVKRFVVDLLNLPESTDIDIDLAATRGPTGFTATVDLQLAGTTKAPVVREEPKEEVAPIRRTRRASAESETVTPDVNEETIPHTEVVTSDEPDLPFEPNTEAHEPAQEETPRRATSGLFDGLKKPKND